MYIYIFCVKIEQINSLLQSHQLKDKKVRDVQGVQEILCRLPIRCNPCLHFAARDLENYQYKCTVTPIS